SSREHLLKLSPRICSFEPCSASKRGMSLLLLEAIKMIHKSANSAQCSLSGREEPTTIVACSLLLINLVGTIDYSTTITEMQADVCLLIASPQATVRTHLQALCFRPNHALIQPVNGWKVPINPSTIGMSVATRTSPASPS